MSDEVKPCVKCGATERYKDGRCKPCMNESARRYAAANPEAARERVRNWQITNPDKYRALHKRGAEKNKDFGNAYRRANYEIDSATRLRRLADNAASVARQKAADPVAYASRKAADMRRSRARKRLVLVLTPEQFADAQLRGLTLPALGCKTQ